MWYGFLADLIVGLHVGYIAYVVLGQAAILVGWAFRRQWARNFWFRATHLFAIAFVAFEEAIDMVCPLTEWENSLRELAGQETRAGTFMGRLFHDLIFLNLPSHYFTWMHVGFAVVVIGTFLLFPPRLPNWMRPRRPDSRPA
jgi:Protein of Unknown function (DUF2784)